MRPFVTVTLEDMEFVDCENCRRIGAWSAAGPNRFICFCGTEVETRPCTCDGHGGPASSTPRGPAATPETKEE